ncbi:GLPGLI family protein [Chryseobacterium bernardetii]|uniref:GLPGLI family protein n=2 Tax=Chryseobacterium TaxID=59732 RepID=A0A543EIY7_9FLAO|nr:MULTISPECIES: GLPGLI family protein [Chryseobacterium]MDR6369984.1 GLPGLI family protein [Chryseobacterium vietnamense]MDR6440773.1 GLPGLI family protein [Chryseobacterium bernardetii]TQM21548.1 GLPGLI family protein [Chryseobacterium aquifrigidense]
MDYHKKLLQLFVLLCSILSYAKSYKQDTLRGEFTYMLKAKFDTRTDSKYEDQFLLQIGDKRAFFANTVSLKGDSVMANAGTTTNNPDGSITLGWKKGTLIPKTDFNFTIIQSNENIQYFDSAFMSLLTYKEPVIKNWNLVNETKVINTIHCKKAEVYFKGRRWIAWYSTDIPFPYGPMKFSGLPGLIIKITDEKGDYDFELVKSTSNSQLKNRQVNIKKSRYTGAVETTQAKLKQAQRNAETNAAGVLASYGTTIIKGQEILKKREKEREENKKYQNPLELTP